MLYRVKIVIIELTTPKLIIIYPLFNKFVHKQFPKGQEWSRNVNISQEGARSIVRFFQSIFAIFISDNGTSILIIETQSMEKL